MAEHAIEEIVTLPDGRRAKVVENKASTACYKCALFDEDCFNFRCSSSDRSDHKDIIYKEIKEE